MATKTKSAPLDPTITDRLLGLLSTDDAYRARFQQDPRAALEEIGYESPTPAKMTACGAMPVAIPESLIDCKVDELASKEVIAAARDEIRTMLTGGLTQVTPRLDASEKTDSRRFRK
jgi:putative modified peptide